MNWAQEYRAAFQVTDLARDPDDPRVTRQSAVTIAGLLFPVTPNDAARLDGLFKAYANGLRGYYNHLTATMRVMLRRAAERIEPSPSGPGQLRLGNEYISLDPRDYTTFSDPDIGGMTVISIHTRPERCWFLGVLRFEGALGLSLGRMRVMKPTEQGVYPVTIRTKWRALTNKKKQEEVRDAYQRLLHG